MKVYRIRRIGDNNNPSLRIMNEAIKQYKADGVMACILGIFMYKSVDYCYDDDCDSITDCGLEKPPFRNEP